MAVLIDTRRYVETPEGVELALDVAGPVARLWAWLLDAFIRGVAMIGMSIVSLLLGEYGMGMLLIGMFLLEWWYPVVFEVLLGGATPGKLAVGLVVLHDDGTPVTWRASLVRNLLRFVDGLPIVPLFALVTMGMSTDFKRIGDHAAGTVVVYRHTRRKSPPLPNVPTIPLPVPLAVHEQRAIVDFAQRSDTWSDDRVAELAEILSPMVGGPGPVAARRLQGMARWISGGR